MQAEAISAHEKLCDAIHAAAEAGETTFNYSHNYVLKAFPVDIKLLKPTLQILHIDNCFELTTLPPSIGDLTNLRWLNISYNNLTELPSEIAKLRNLERLHINNNRITALPLEVWALKSLQELHCDSNQLRALPTGILFLRGMRELFINNNPLLADSDAEGAEVSELFPPVRYGDCGNCNVRFSKSIMLVSFHAFCGNSSVSFVHHACSPLCEEQLRFRLQHEESAPCRLIVSGSGKTYACAPAEGVAASSPPKAAATSLPAK
jgi:Leucine-rich repeat (LRR) protein